ncbi:gamma-glutamyl-gamma-aminobutyrate hydrolase family protein [Sinorhizobium fredii]|uniref:gamma-glutamyl-gamma-aminobutyrate hydrolase family protein n=1 Tax=Rhizobium fredii TaxID=380 RepID=UPI00117D23AA
MGGEWVCEAQQHPNETREELSLDMRRAVRGRAMPTFSICRGLRIVMCKETM